MEGTPNAEAALKTTFKPNEKAARDQLRRTIFALAPQVHPEANPGAELLDAIRADIVLHKLAAAPSLSSLSTARMRELVSLYRRGLGQSDRPPRDYERVGHQHHPDWMITPEQQHRIAELLERLGYDASGRRNLVRRVCKKDWAQTRADGGKMIECLTAMLKRNYHPSSPGNGAQE